MTCRLCGERTDMVLPLKPTPLGDAYTDKPEPAELHPLDLWMCNSCGHVQHDYVVDPEKLFRKYTYRTGKSAAMVKHCREFVDSMPTPNSVLEIGSNDGTLLKMFRDKGATFVWGVEPSDACEDAYKLRISTVNDFYPVDYELGKFDLIVSMNSFAHAQDLNGMAAQVKKDLAPDGAFVFEVGYLGDLVDKMLLETIYHEHTSYHSITPLIQFFGRHGLRVVDCQRIPTKGGSIRVFVEHVKTLGAPIFLDERYLRERATWDKLAKRIKETADALDQALNGDVVAGFGASIGTTTMLYQLNLEKKIQWLIDEEPAKLGKYSPGLGIPVGNSMAAEQIFLFARGHEKQIREKYPNEPFVSLK